MNRSTLLCHMELNNENNAVLSVTADLAATLGAAVIGIAACQPIQPFGEMPYAGDMLEADIAEIRRQTKLAERRFRSFLTGKVGHLAFRAAATYQELADYIAGQGRAADFIITGPDLGGGMLGHTRHANIGDLVMNAGRPVIIVPADAAGCRLDTVVVAWKDRREARRALLDALPLLEKAGRVVVAEVARKGDSENAVERTSDVVAWLERHGIRAEAMVRAAEGRDVESLAKLLDEQNCDLLVAGAYSHSRIGEWAFGGVTTDLLLQPNRCTLVSH
jgi:nucleotide-binding universal stress UspA family protein